MGKSLVIVESPAKAKTIKKYLGSNYIVEASMGHVRDLPKSTLGVDIENNYMPKYITIRGKGDLLATLRKASKKCTKVFLATDPDREGEAISWHLMNALKLPEESTCRIEFNEITKSAIKEAIKKPREVNFNLVNAQQARRVIDRLVGYEISPILWRKVKWGLSAGRVQSITLKLICDREKEIKNFVTEEYWSIDCDVKKDNKKINFKLVSFQNKKVELKNETESNEILKEIENKKAKIIEVKKQNRVKKPLPPFTTSTLQQEAYKKLNFTTKRTMSVAQVLYEGLDIEKFGTISLITYMRTDSVRVSNEAIENAKDFIVKNYGEEYYPETPNIYKGKKNSQDAHEAVRPSHTEITPEMIKGKVKPELYKLYDLIWSRFMASQMVPAKIEGTSVKMNIGDYSFRTSGNVIKFEGYMKIYKSEDEEDKTLPIFIENEELKVEKINSNQHFTQPPAHYSEGTLVKTLEENGIGRPSTYSPTITTILARRYVEKDNKNIIPTELGIIVENIMAMYFKQIMNVDFTVKMENELDQIEVGNMDWKKVVSDYFEPIREEIKIAEKELAKISIEDKVSDIPCDKCNTLMVIKQGRYGDFLACPNYPECKNTKPIFKKLEVTCPKCGGEIHEKRSKKGRTFYGCGNYPECDFVSWGEPSNKKCEKCDSVMVKKYSKAKGNYLECSNSECKEKIFENN